MRKGRKHDKDGGVPGAKRKKEAKEFKPAAEHLLEPYLKQTFEYYGIWRNLPPGFSAKKKEEIEKMFGRDADVVKDLITIRTQAQFGKKYDVHPNTLTAWNKKLDTGTSLDWIRKWGKKLTRNVFEAMYRGAISQGPTAFLDRQMWLKTVEQFQEKSVVSVEGLADGMLAAMRAKRKPK